MNLVLHAKAQPKNVKHAEMAGFSKMTKPVKKKLNAKMENTKLNSKTDVTLVVKCVRHVKAPPIHVLHVKMTTSSSKK